MNDTDQIKRERCQFSEEGWPFAEIIVMPPGKNEGEVGPWVKLVARPVTRRVERIIHSDGQVEYVVNISLVVDTKE